MGSCVFTSFRGVGPMSMFFFVLVVTPGALNFEVFFRVTLCMIWWGPVSIKYIFTIRYMLLMWGLYFTRECKIINFFSKQS